MSCSDLAGVVGRRLLFIGTESFSMPVGFCTGIARFAAQHGVDTVLLKVADGADWWYEGIDGYRQRRNAMKGEGVGVIPYMYSYGDKFGALGAEADIIATLLAEDGVACMDAEAEWNGQASWASRFASRLQGHPGTFLVSTWGNPIQQQWGDIIRALNSVVAAYMPQQYTFFLASCWPQFGDLGAQCLIPTVNLVNNFGPNDPVAIAQAASQQGHAALSVWYHATAMNNPQLFDAVLATFPKTSQEDNMLPWDDPMITSFFTHISDTLLHCNTTGTDLHDGMLACWMKNNGELRLPLTPEIGVIDGYRGTMQVFECGVLCYDPERRFDNPPINGDVYAMKVCADTPGLRQLIAHAGLALGQDGLPSTAIDNARTAAQSILASLQPAKISVVASA